MQDRIDGRRGEYQAATGHNWPTEVDRAGMLSRHQSAERNIPQNFSGEQIQCFRCSPRRAVARSAAGRKEECAVEAVWRGLLIAELAVDAIVLILMDFSGILRTRNEFDPRDETVGVYDHQVVLRVKGGTAPVHASNISGRLDRPAQTWWCEDPFVARSPDFLLAPFDVLRLWSPGIGGLKSFWHERDGRKRLSR